MKAKIFTFVRGLKNGTPPRFQSYLKNLTLLLVMLMSVNVWGEEATLNTTSNFAGEGKDVSIGDITMKISANGGTNPQISSSYLRVYAKNIISFDGKGNKITKVEFTHSSADYNLSKPGTPTCSEGSISYSTKYSTWTNDDGASSFTITIGGTSNHTRIGSIKVTYTAGSTYTINYTLNGGTHGTNHPTSGSIGTAFAVSAPTKTNYVFTGWMITNGLNTSTAKWGTTSSPTTPISSTSSLCVNGTSDVYFLDLGVKDATITLTANWEIIQPATIKLSEAGVITDGPSDKFSGDKYTLPTTCNQSCGDKTFVGWSSVVVDSETKPTTNFYEKGAEVVLVANNTFYAVYADESIGSAEMTLNSTNLFSILGNGYGTTDFTYDGVTFGRNGDVGLVSNKIQFAGGTSKYFYSKTSFPGVITKIESSTAGNNSVKVFASSSSTFSSTANATITTSSSANISFKENDNIKYVKFANGSSNYSTISSITITYNATSYSNYTTTCRTLTKIEVSTEPSKKIYTVGDNFDPTGLVIKATYDSGDPDYIAYSDNESKFTFTPLLTTALTAGNTSVAIGYGGLTCTQNITVNAKADLESISVNTDNCQTNFIKNEEFKSTGLVVTAHYVGGTTETVSPTTINSSGYTMGSPGTYTIYVSYTDESGTKETSYYVYVWELSASSNNTALGKVNRSKYVITATPETGVTYANPAYTVDGSADVVQGTDANINKFTVSNVTADTKVTINFVEKVKDTYIDQMHGQLTTDNVFYDSYNAPPISYSHTTTGDNCQDDHIYFAGWTETPTQVGSSTAPADMFAAGASKTASGATYYAVWAGGEVTTFAAANTSNLTKGSGNTWTDNTTGLKLTIADGQLYTGSPKTFTVNGNSYMTISHTTKKLSMVEVTLSAAGYEINSVTPGTLSSNSTSVTSQTITNINATSVKCSAPSGTGTTSQIRATQIKATCLSDYLTACCTPLSAPASITITEQTPNSLSFSWAEVANASGYEYKLSTATEWTTAVGLSAKIEGLAAGTKYTIQVRATDNTDVYCENGAVAEATDVMTYYKTEIYISTQPTKKVYVEGDLFDKEGMVVWYTHEDKKESVSNKVTWSPSGELTTDVTEITVSYKVSDDVTLTTTQEITVKAKWTMLYYINGAEYKRYCTEGEAADVPEVPAVDGFTFVGWVKTAMDSETPIKPTYALAANATKYTPTANNDKLYTVYERKEIAMVDGYKLYETTNSKWVGPRSSGNSYFTYKTDASQAEIFLIDQIEGQMAFVSDGEPTYFYGYSSNSTITFKSTLDADGAWAIVNAGNDIYTFQASGTYYLAYNSNANPNRFATYSGNSNGKFSLTPAKIEMSQPYYNTSAVVPSVHHIEVKTAPTTTTYYEGDKFDATGLVVWAYYSADDEVGKEVPASQYTLQIGSVTDLDDYELKATDENVVITFRNAQCPQSITVNAITLNSITVTTPPNQTKYTPGAAFNPAGMVVFAVYNDTRKNKDVPLKVDDADGYTYSPATLTELGEQNVTISYTDGTRGTQTTTTPVTVNSALNEIRVKTNPAKMTYIEGELFDKTGMVVEGSYGESADWKDITGWTYEPTTAIVAKGTLTADEQRDITIKYSESGVDKETVLKVTVQPYPRYTVTFSVNGNTNLQLTETTPEGGIAIPTNPANIGDYTFVGWAEETMAAESPEKPAMITEAVGATYHITANKTLYAVYSMEKDAAIYGNIVSVVSNSKTYYLKSREDNTKKYFRYSESKADALLIYQQEGNLLYVGSGNTKYYFYNSSSSDLAFTTTKPNSDNWTITTNNGITTVYCSSTSRYLAFNNRFAAYQDNDSYPHNLIFEKTEESIILKVPHYTTSPETAKTPEVKFDTKTPSTPVLTNVEDHTSLATYFNNTLSSENTTGAVVYTLADGDDAVATIAADGTVTAKKAGSVTVTATVGAVDGVWKEASASYTLTFTKIAPTIAFDDNQPTEVYVGNVVTVHATSNSDGTVYYYDNSDKLDVNTETGEVSGIATNNGVNVYAYVDATDLFTAKNTTSSGAKTVIKVLSNAKNQVLTFAKPEGYDFAPKASVEPFINTLNGAKTTVTYSLTEGSTAGLVTVNETTGEVTVNTNLSGSATVVATAEAGNVTEEGIIWAYGKATAEYMISVNYFRPVLTLTPGLDTQQELWRCTQTVSLTAQEGDKIYYTLNGTDPTTSSTLYNAPFDVDDKMVDANLQVIIKAIAVSNDGLQTSPVLTKTLTKAVPTMTAKVGEEDVTDDDEIELDANDVVTLKATACKIDYRILNHDGTEIEKKVGNAKTEITFSKGGTFTLEATPRWSNTNGFKGETKSWNVIVKGAGHLPINYNGNNTGLAELPYFTMEGTFGSYKADNYEKTQIKIEGGTLTVSFLEEPTTLSYHLMLNGTANDGNSVVVQQSADGHSWTTIVTHCTANGNLLTTNPSKQEGARDPYQFNLNSATRYVRWTYTKVSGNIGLGSIYIGTNSLIVDDTQDLDPAFRGSVIVENGGKLTVVDLSEITDLTIEPGGVVDAHTYTNAALTVNNLYLQSADHKSGQFLIDNDDIDLEGDAYFDLTLNAAPRTWYDFAVPFKVNRNSISLANGAAMPEYDIIQYNGETRATSGANKSAWEYVDEGDLNPGTFYMIMFASNVETIRFTKNDGAKLNNADYVVVSEYELQTGNPLDANWNGIANNTLQYVNLGFTEVDNVNIKAQVYNPTSKSYTAYNKNEVTFVVGAPFFVQVAKEDLVDWSTAPIHDILRAPSSEVKSVGEFTLELIDKGVTCDRLFVSASEDATDSYQVGHDLAKMGVSTTVAQMWINNYNTKLCANEAVLINGQATYQMEVFVPAEGEYTIAITSAPENATLYLTIDGQVAWNLSESAYVANLTKGTHNEFGLLLIANERTTPTNLNGLNGNIKAQKIFKDYNIYILRDAQMYNTQGVKVQ